MFIFIDESGTLPDPTDEVVVISAVAVNSINELNVLFKKTKKRDSDTNSSEIKFYSSGDRTKKLFFQTLQSSSVQLYFLVLEKQDKKIADTPEHFAMVCSFLLNIIFCCYKDVESLKFIFDRHFQKISDQNVFDNSMMSLLKKEINIAHVYT